MKTIIVAGLILAGAATPAFAKGKSYTIEQSPKTHKCYVTSKKPHKGFAIIGKPYFSHAAAKKAMKSMKACKIK